LLILGALDQVLGVVLAGKLAEGIAVKGTLGKGFAVVFSAALKTYDNL